MCDYSTFLQEQGIRIDFSLKMADKAEADQLKDSITSDTINQELEKLGLPSAKIVQAPTVEQVDSSASRSPDTDEKVAYDACVCRLI